MLFDTLGLILVDGNKTVDEVEDTKLDGIKVKHVLTADGEIYYNWGHGIPFYVCFLSLLFMSTIVLEGVDTSIMAKVTPQKLNEQFINVGLLATLIGTLGRVVADSILTGESLFSKIVEAVMTGRNCVFLTPFPPFDHETLSSERAS